MIIDKEFLKFEEGFFKPYFEKFIEPKIPTELYTGFRVPTHTALRSSFESL